MKKIVTLVLLTLTLSFLNSNVADAQTSLTQGDIAFIGMNLDGNDSYAFILLKDIDGSTTINFTDCGWNDIGGFSCVAGDGSSWTWSANGTARTCGTVIRITVNAPGLTTTVGAIGGTVPVLSGIGDQVFAFQGLTSSPTFISGIHSNILAGTTNDANWDNASTNNQTSALPNTLTNGVDALRLHNSEAEVDNWQYNCAVVSGPAATVRAAINNLSNWNNDNLTAFSPAEPACFWSVTCATPCTDPDNPVFSPASATITCGGSTTLNWAGATLNDATNWHIYTGGCGIAELTSQLATSLLVSPTVTTTYYIRGEDGTGCVDESIGVCGSITITVNPISVGFTALADLCVNAGNQTGLGGGTPTGGVYSGPGVTDAGNGTNYSFNPATAGAGIHTITYTIGGACPGSANDNVAVFGLPTVTFTALADLCLDAGTQTGLTGGSPTGGVYSGPGVTDVGDGINYSFDPAAAGAGTHIITYNFT
ncbi:MAG: hypothetical protein ACI9J3_003895, partial [Parvicellaceae bacterium]